MNTTEAGEEFRHPPLEWLDLAFGSTYLISFIIGLPGNIVAAWYFITRRKDLPTLLYVLTTITDSVLIAFSLIVGICFFMERRALLFQYPWFCYTWSLVFHSLQYFSIFLVAVLSLSRTFSLLRPLRRISKKKTMIGVAVYGVTILLYRQVPQWAGIAKDVYFKADVYCWMDSTRENASEEQDPYVIIQIISTILLLLPVLPIVVSCVVSTRLVLAQKSISKNSALANKAKNNATITIVLITFVYIVCNIPLVANSFIWVYELIRYPDHDSGPFYNSSVIAELYIWNFVDVLSVVINSSLNFVIFVTRVKKFREWMVEMFMYGVLRKKKEATAINATIRYGRLDRQLTNGSLIRDATKPFFGNENSRRSSQRSNLSIPP